MSVAVDVSDTKCWTEEPLAMYFGSEEIFQEFLFEVKKLQTRLLSENMYDRITSFSQFYRGFKQQCKILQEYYGAHVPTFDVGSLSCIGNALLLQKELLKSDHPFFAKRFPDLERYLYFSGSSLTVHTGMDVMLSEFVDKPPQQISSCKEHVVVILKCSFQRREGYVIMDIGGSVAAPVVVMADGQPPQTKPFLEFWRSGLVSNDYKLEGNYIHWTVSQMTDEQQSAKHCWMYVAKKFTNLLELEKRGLMLPYKCMLARDKTGPTAAIYCDYRRHNGVTVFIRPTSHEMSYKTLIPFNYLLEDDAANHLYEDAIDKCADLMRVSRKRLNNHMRALAEIRNDKEFYEPMMKIHLQHAKSSYDIFGND